MCPSLVDLRCEGFEGSLIGLMRIKGRAPRDLPGNGREPGRGGWRWGERNKTCLNRRKGLAHSLREKAHTQHPGRAGTMGEPRRQFSMSLFSFFLCLLPFSETTQAVAELCCDGELLGCRGHGAGPMVGRGLQRRCSCGHRLIGMGVSSKPLGLEATECGRELAEC